MTPRRRWLLVAAGVALVVLLALAGPGLCTRLYGDHVDNNALVGRTEGQVAGSYGSAVREWDGYEPLGLSRPVRLPPGPIRTVVYEPRGLLHLEGGTLWVWFCRRGDEWVCFESCWFADGVDF